MDERPEKREMSEALKQGLFIAAAFAVATLGYYAWKFVFFRADWRAAALWVALLGLLALLHRAAHHRTARRCDEGARRHVGDLHMGDDRHVFLHALGHVALGGLAVIDVELQADAISARATSSVGRISQNFLKL